MEKTTWFEVYEFVNDDIMEGTRTLEVFYTLEEAEKYCEGHENRYIDEWQQDSKGCANRIF